MLEYRWKGRARCSDGSISEWTLVKSFEIPMLRDHTGELFFEAKKGELKYLSGNTITGLVLPDSNEQLILSIFDLNGRLHISQLVSYGQTIHHQLPEGLYILKFD